VNRIGSGKCLILPYASLAWSEIHENELTETGYRHPPRVGSEKQALVAAAPRAAREIAWRAQVRLCARFRTLSRKGKKSTVVATAIARELAAFIWAINREVAVSRQACRP